MLAAVVYGRAVGHDFLFNWDDNLYVINNETIRGFSLNNLRSAFGPSSIGQYNPLALISFMLDYTLWGLWPGGYHLTNIIIHAVNGLLVYRLLWLWYGERLLCLIAAAIFLVHPVQVESVAWVSERKGLLATLFFLLSWLEYCRYVEAGKGKGRFAYIASLTAFVLSLLAKTSGVVLPIILLLYDLCFLPQDRRLRWKNKLPYVAASAAFSAMELYSEMPEHGGSRAGYHGGSPLATFFTMLPVYCRYLGLLIWPAGLNIEHWPTIYRTVNASVVGAAMLLGAVVFAGIRLYRTDRKLGFWVLFFWVGLLPVSQIVPLYLLMYEHYLYLPIIGVGALAGGGALYLRQRLGTRYSGFLYAVLTVGLLALSIVSFQRVAVWKDSLTLWSDAASKSPTAFRVWDVLGEAYRQDGNFDDSLRAYERSLELNPASTDSMWALGDLHTELGNLDKGYAYLKRLLGINPTYVKGWTSLGSNYRNRGNYVEAEKAYRHAVTLQPDAVQIIILLGKLSVLQGRFDQARDFYLQAETSGWNNAENAYRLACTEARAGRRQEALSWLEQALNRGYRNYDTLISDTELSALWEEPRFNYLLALYFPELDKER
ncbi:MAG: tetratricopeptide repeat protein [Steroidobacteraceae bacterium]|nr:tetratricopeptide repeat protein [Deltaproteobacteria bacterium]